MRPDQKRTTSLQSKALELAVDQPCLLPPFPVSLGSGRRGPRGRGRVVVVDVDTKIKIKIQSTSNGDSVFRSIEISVVALMHLTQSPTWQG